MYILASDFDGTLNQGGISERNREAIHRFREAGNLFGVVTGRDTWMYRHMVETGCEFDFVLVFNGGMAIDRDGNTIYEIRTKNGGVIREIAEICKKHTERPLGCCVGYVRTTFSAHVPDGNDDYAPLTVSDGMDEFTMLNTACSTDEVTAACVAEINERCGYAVNALQNGTCIDIPPRGVDKGEGCAKYAAIVSVPEDNIYCAGDNLNDMAMLTRFHGCAVENARSEVKEAAEGIYRDIASIIEYIESL